MGTTLIISRDRDLKRRVEARTGKRPITWVEDCDMLEEALSVPVGRVLVDLNVQWEKDISLCIARCKSEGGAESVVAFLHEQAGEIAIRAHLAGADRVIPQTQLESELEELLG